MAGCIEIYTDGAASGNPGPGGYGIVMKYGPHRKEISGGFRHTTNNRMELLAVIIALESISNKALPVKVYSDSKYVVDAINKKWIWQWKRNAFAKRMNVDLWMRFLNIYDPSKHEFIWVKGHADNPENNRCDEMAVNAYKVQNLPVDTGYTGGA
jgi:ribonuclease HI